MLGHTAIPGPSAANLLCGLRQSPHLYLYAMMKEYGDIVRCRILKELFVINHPDLARHVLVEVHRVVDKRHFVNERMKRVFGSGLISSEGDLWHQQRRILTPAFHRGTVETCTAMVETAVERLFERWTRRDPGAPALDLRREFHQLTLEIAGRILFGVADPQSLQFLVGAMEKAAELISRSLPFNLPAWIPIPSEMRFRSLVSRIEEVLRGVLRERRERSSPWPDDALTLLLQAKDAKGRSLPDELVVDEMKSLLIAGHYTTADALTWTVYSLSKDPGLADALENEVERERARTAASDGSLDLFLENALNESMRLYSPVWGAWYHLREGLEVGTYRLPGRSLVLINLFNIHRNPRLFRDPEHFDPARFAREHVSFPPHAFMPFGMGPRKCIGAGMALKVMPLVLRKVLLAFRIRLVTQEPVGTAVRATLTQDRPILITAEPRSP